MRFALTLLIVVGLLVLLGQLWPEGAPPFARAVNVAYIVASLALCVRCLAAARDTAVTAE